MNLVVSRSTDPTLVHEEREVGLASMWYPVIVEPPSDVGGCHSRSAVLSVTAATRSGPLGDEGLSMKKNLIILEY